jgi:glutaredoxin 3
MASVKIYTTAFCPYCHAAKALLNKKGIAYEEIDVSYDPEERKRMTVRANGRRTVPQIFVGQSHVGGFDDLYDLDRRGGLEPLLAAAQEA